MSPRNNVIEDLTSLVDRELISPEDFAQAHSLYRTVFGYGDTSLGINPRLLATLGTNGGSAVGIFTSEPANRLVGFSYGYPGVDKSGQNYHYSQAAVVDPTLQGRGVGRLLKAAQAEVARKNGATHMRWSFDPVQARNAHFNLDTLGSRGRWFTPNLYGPDCDRMTVEWDLGKENSVSRVSAVTGIQSSPSDWGKPFDRNGRVFLPIPAQFKNLDVGAAAEVRAQLREALTQLLASGLVAFSCDRVGEDTAMYCFTLEY